MHVPRTDHGTCMYHRVICIYEHTNVPGSSELTWTLFHPPKKNQDRFFPNLTLLALSQCKTTSAYEEPKSSGNDCSNIHLILDQFISH